MSDFRGLDHPLEAMSELLSVVDHPAPSSNKYRHFELFLADYLGVDPKSVYTAFISKAGNVSVRFDQSARARRATILVALFDPRAREHPIRTVEALNRYCTKHRKGVEVLMLHVSEGAAWRPYAVVVPAGEQRLQLTSFLQLEPDVRVDAYHSRQHAPESKSKSAPPMKFYVVEYGDETPTLEYPFALLRSDGWDDYGLKTMFFLTLFLGPGREVTLGELKIMHRGQSGGRTPMPDGVFSRLDANYCSLGQSFSYYTVLDRLPEWIKNAVLRGLCDAVFNPSIHENFRDEEAFQMSLRRTGQAVRVLEDAPAMFAEPATEEESFDGDGTGEALSVSFRTKVGGDPFDIDFAFNQSDKLPDRINAVIGYNGTGKTQLLANLALVSTADMSQRERLDAYGRLKNSGDVRFSSVIAISYSAFDTFVLPDAFWRGEEVNMARQRLVEKGDVFGYAYCGLRKWTEEQGVALERDAVPGTAQEPRAPMGLKAIYEMTEEFSKALGLARDDRKILIFREALAIIGAEPSFKRMGLEVYEATGTDWRNNFAGLSTGHKIVLNIVTQVVGHSAPGSLVLIDEPESHLHPSLLAALMRAINLALRLLNSYAIVATHSPVVLQEIPRRYVRILQRFGQKTRVTKPLTETFGENVGYLTNNIFDLDSTKTDYHAILGELAAQLSLDEIERLFDDEMSMQARAYVLNVKRQGRP